MNSIINPKLLWSHARKKLKTKNSIAPLLGNPEDRASTKFTDKEKANILQKKTASVFTHEVNQYSHQEQIHAKLT